ncbi:hypothetical protein [Lysinibacillus sp. G4S2]|uniref:hypothetical protein n=1 Tax=Lysinibacillus sp. G4S2 TaxID=3055859 RepID=UPI0025A097A8|nr:hypothetical protein [Lysinibacillus sp. G4S2]MDM5246526.1 hypothetical protein [Lysinibacillus sp. G4S2]
MCDSEAANVAAATDVFCAKAERQQQMFFARKRSANVAGSNRCFLRESGAAVARWLVTKALSQVVML